MSRDLSELFDRNRDWARRTEARQPGFFTGLLAQQTPRYMWLGCADSRVPANELVDLLPGEMFVHRNVANLLVHSDLNALSVVQYAVDVLRVEHIIVVGHSKCGGVRAALSNTRAGLVDNWLRHVQDVRDGHADLLAQLEEPHRIDALVELNVLEQARNVCRTTVLRDAWQRGQTVIVHGWVYGLHDGLLSDLSISAGAIDEVDSAYRCALESLRRRWLGSA
ncbi:MAG: carbonate dehydratase [Actinobacteria bacterium]|nr:carbonate dehydratase [Actinomycetota bacterium]